MATLDGEAIFGVAATVRTSDAPRTLQKTAFGGINGVDTLDLGQHGRTTEISCLMFGAGDDSSGLSAAIDYLRSFKDGLPHTLTDSFGVAWPYVFLESAEPAGRVIGDSRGYYQPYTVRLFHAL